MRNVIDERRRGDRIGVESVILLLVIILVIVTMGLLDSGDKIGSIVGGAIATFGLIWVATRFIHQWLIWRNPIEVTYLIPMSHYPKADFPNNPDHEQYPVEMQLPIGEGHIIMFRIRSKIDAPIDEETLEFPNGGPEISGSNTNPYLTKRDMFSGKIQDWWGIWHTPQSSMTFRKDEYSIRAFNINTHNEYAGIVRLRFRIQGKRNVIIYDLPLRIVKPVNLSNVNKEG